ncbi:hypothetical protein BpHYR1_006212 [Brachionus plicatilis]|uniref:Uncharacterized protein n=1 Tax=Brachionus plicatilis TaxID=10195 RepID=A0A3M7Q1B9_BRAPC|nr:hypothetical protein BpHYR1_006212 [Brachionus plicatilis]
MFIQSGHSLPRTFLCIHKDDAMHTYFSRHYRRQDFSITEALLFLIEMNNQDILETEEGKHLLE